MNHRKVVALYEEHGRALLAYACALVRDPSAAEDVLHQVFLNLLRGKRTIDGEPAAYLFRSVRNTALNHIRGQSREVVVLKIWGQLTFEEAAAVIGISPNTAASRYRYGLEKLKDIWK